MAFEVLYEGFIIWVILAMLGAILYSMRYLILLERRIARIDTNLDKIARRILEEEKKIEGEEKKIETLLLKKSKKK